MGGVSLGVGVLGGGWGSPSALVAAAVTLSHFGEVVCVSGSEKGNFLAAACKLGRLFPPQKKRFWGYFGGFCFSPPGKG